MSESHTHASFALEIPPAGLNPTFQNTKLQAHKITKKIESASKWKFADLLPGSLVEITDCSYHDKSHRKRGVDRFLRGKPIQEIVSNMIHYRWVFRHTFPVEVLMKSAPAIMHTRLAL